MPGVQVNVHVEEADMTEEGDLSAGDFSEWMISIQGALSGERGSDVPCGACTACCTASQFIHIRPDETDTLSRIPAALLFPAPRLPRGHVLLGYDEKGHCPMLVDNACSIYEHRPVTCRVYDCRIFPAAGLGPRLDDGDDDGGGDDDKVLIARQARRWRFGFPAQSDRIQHDAVRAAAAFLKGQKGVADGSAPTDTTQLAVLAIEIHQTFLRRDSDTGETTVVDPDPQAVRVEIMRRRRAQDAP